MRRRVSFCLRLVLFAACGAVFGQVGFAAGSEQGDSATIRQSKAVEKKASSAKFRKSRDQTFLAAAIQAVSQMGDPAGNRRRLEGLIRKAAPRGAKVIVLPECASLGI